MRFAAYKKVFHGCTDVILNLDTEPYARIILNQNTHRWDIYIKHNGEYKRSISNITSLNLCKSIVNAILLITDQIDDITGDTPTLDIRATAKSKRI